MRETSGGQKKTIEQVQAPRSRKSKLEHVSAEIGGRK